MYLPNTLRLRRNNLCPPGHPVCGPGPTIGVTGDPPAFDPRATLPHPLVPIGSTRNLIGIILGIILLLIGIGIYTIFGEGPRKKLKEWREQRQTKLDKQWAPEPRHGDQKMEEIAGDDETRVDDKYEGHLPSQPPSLVGENTDI
ncbi:hypothetical protein POSPLADRAFT_1051754 [Postia placenta MAD-698-R-SB12]|uniref:Uncharacterized protein n=1 Tax=Postia placenta MAD-698-R-SB12 TaxID=670580 RepID=A0A1X6NG75_9APHY|nr:hypothetical protein POSPLADRAFT_1051754 [Postia placenta MAD-698-R-SB12]OSX67625.1 hypothetical protein POSPLADRAFT_1051754 [Postia placenta MAD-698-R-SB12]